MIFVLCIVSSFVCECGLEIIEINKKWKKKKFGNLLFMILIDI